MAQIPASITRRSGLDKATCTCCFPFTLDRDTIEDAVKLLQVSPTKPNCQCPVARVHAINYLSTRIGVRQQGRKNIMRADRIRPSERHSPACLLQSGLEITQHCHRGFIRPALPCIEQDRYFLMQCPIHQCPPFPQSLTEPDTCRGLRTALVVLGLF